MTEAQHTISICGIDTGVGKSIVTGLLARFLADSGHSVTTLKLVQTGCTGISEDIRRHRELMGQALNDADTEGTTCPYVFPFPASPCLAARLEGKIIEPEILDQATVALQAEHQWLLVEGAGGLLVPLTEQLTLLDYLAEKGYPMVLVSSPRLGSINHTLLSLEALKNRNINLLGLVYNLHGDTPREILQDTLRECKQGLKTYGFQQTLIMMPDINESRATNWAVLLDQV